ERRDRLAAHSGNRSHAAPDLLAVQEHRASATLRQAATEARTMQVELVVQDVEERRVKARGHRMNETVHLDLQLARHSHPPDRGSRGANASRCADAEGKGQRCYPTAATQQLLQRSAGSVKL